MADSLKPRLFRLFYAVSREHNTDERLAIILIVVCFIQIYDILLSPLMMLPFSGYFYNMGSRAFDSFRIFPFVVLQIGPSLYIRAIFVFLGF